MVMIEDFIYAFLTTLAEEEKVYDLTIKDKILDDLIKSDEDFNHVKLKYEETEWLLPLPNYKMAKQPQEKTVQVTNYL